MCQSETNTANSLRTEASLYKIKFKDIIQKICPHGSRQI